MGRKHSIQKPDVKRLTISEGDFLDVKARLNHGEYDDHLARISPFQTPGEPVRMDTKQIRTSKVLAYLVGWSLTDDGKPLPYSPDMPENARVSVLNSLDRDLFREIYAAIDAHEDASDAEAAARKNGQGQGSVSLATLPSLDVAASPMGMSEN